MITIRVVDRIDGHVLSHSLENVTVAVALLVSLFARPQFDPWGVVYPTDDADERNVAVSCTTEIDREGNATVTVERSLVGVEVLSS